MNIIEFRKRLAPFQLISLQDVRKAAPDLSYRQLDRWAKKEYLSKVHRGFYLLAGQPVDRQFLFHAANRIYPPSYVSLEAALKYYGLIPEETFQITSVSTRKTIRFDTSLGGFSYRHLKPGLFFGYRLLELGNRKVLLAEPEKALLDYLYFTPSLQSADDFRSLRIDRGQFAEQVNPKRLAELAGAFAQKSLQRRAKLFLTTVENDA